MNEFYLECQEDTCLSQKLSSLNTCKAKKNDMQVFNGICFEKYNNIVNQIEELAKNNIKIEEQNNIVISAYSYNGDYSKNFDKIFEYNIDTIVIDLRECIEKYKKY